MASVTTASMRESLELSMVESADRCANDATALCVAIRTIAATTATSVRRTPTALMAVSDYRVSYVTITSMSVPFSSAAVLGAGTMGAQIAAHLSNAGVPVTLLDVSRDAAAQGLARLKSLK